MAFFSLLHSSRKRKYVYRIILLCVWLLNHSTTLNKILNNVYVIGILLYPDISQFLTNRNVTGQTRELMR
jgi:hypothetical protein